MSIPESPELPHGHPGADGVWQSPEENIIEDDDSVDEQLEQHSDDKNYSGIVSVTLAGQRLDLVASRIFPDYSRARLKSWIEEGSLLLNGEQVKPKVLVNANDELTLQVRLPPQVFALPEPMDLDIIYEDDSILVINKAAGMVVHPGAGNHSGTLVNGLLHYLPESQVLPRAGLVHRIDKDTSGLLVVAKTLEAQHALVAQLQDKSVYRVYDAVVYGTVPKKGTINQPIRRHPVDRLKMAVQTGGKPSVTHYKVKESFLEHTWLKVQLETGRTHQIRVHMTHEGYPLIGDPTYGGKPKPPRAASAQLISTLKNFERQALHAAQLGLIHPVTGEKMLFEAPMPDDMQKLLEELRENRQLYLMGELAP